jgi:hypothetical protein
MTKEKPSQPREGALLARARARLTPKMSIRAAASLAGISEGRWRQIESGYTTISAGVYPRVEAPAPTLAKMARAVEVSPAELRNAGRADAAGVLKALLQQEPAAPRRSRSARQVHAIEAPDSPYAAHRRFVLATDGATDDAIAAAYEVAARFLETLKNQQESDHAEND